MITLGCIADDFTGGTDVAAALRRAGMSVVLQFGVPADATPLPDVDAVVVALKTRTLPASEAVRESLSALRWLQQSDVEKVYFKYCSTFDSTDAGNIGPVTDALLDALGETATVICPASPEHGRTMYRGHLFVGDDLLSESSMRHHPLTPMTQSKIPDVLARQTTHRVGLLGLPVLRGGPGALARGLDQLIADDVRHVVVDTLDDADLDTVATAFAGLRLLTGGAGLAGALAGVLRSAATADPAPIDDLPGGPGVVLAGSCSATTLDQVARARGVFASHRLDPVETPDEPAMLDRATTWLRDHWSDGPVLVYSSAGPDDRARARAAMGPETSEILERVLGAVAREAVALGARRVVVAGGETSGAVVQALDVAGVVVGTEADRGVPWLRTTGERPVALLLKSGNFGSEDLLVRAMDGIAR